MFKEYKLTNNGVFRMRRFKHYIMIIKFIILLFIVITILLCCTVYRFYE